VQSIKIITKSSFYRRSSVHWYSKLSKHNEMVWNEENWCWTVWSWWSEWSQLSFFGDEIYTALHQYNTKHPSTDSQLFLGIRSYHRTINSISCKHDTVSNGINTGDGCPWSSHHFVTKSIDQPLGTDATIKPMAPLTPPWSYWLEWCWDFRSYSKYSWRFGQMNGAILSSVQLAVQLFVARATFCCTDRCTARCSAILKWWG